MENRNTSHPDNTRQSPSLEPRQTEYAALTLSELFDLRKAYIWHINNRGITHSQKYVAEVEKMNIYMKSAGITETDYNEYIHSKKVTLH